MSDMDSDYFYVMPGDYIEEEDNEVTVYVNKGAALVKIQTNVGMDWLELMLSRAEIKLKE